MKTVFGKTVEVAQVWAAQSQQEARIGSNTWCRGKLLGSYGTVIARQIESREGPVALLSHHRYSNTTAIVIGQARQAAFMAGMLVFEVDDVGGHGPFALSCHTANLALYAKRIDATLDKIAGAKRFNGAVYRREALALIGEAAIYARVFKMKWTWKGRNPLTLRSKTEMTEGF